MDNTRETTIEYIQGEGTATYFTSISSLINRMKKLKESHPNEVDILRENYDGSVLFQIPQEWVKQPGPKREMSEAQIIAASERMKKYHSDRR